MRKWTQCQEFTGFNSTHFGDQAIFLGAGQCDHQPHHHQLYHHIEATLYGIITHHFNHNSRTFEAASSQSFMGGNVMNKKTVYSRKEPNVPGQKNQNLKQCFLHLTVDITKHGFGLFPFEFHTIKAMLRQKWF